jgi:hypothetical protein
MKKYTLILASIFFIVLSCEINQKDILPTDNFVKIYNNSDENIAYFPEAVLQITDGYLMLSGLKNYTENLNEYPTTSLIKTNLMGEIEWAEEYDWRAPVGNLLEFNGTVGFVAMNSSDNAFFVQINLQTGEVSNSYSLNINMPLSAKVNSDGNLIVLSYNYVAWSSVITLFTPAFNKISTEKLFVGDDLVIPVQKHLNKNSTIFPFFIGEWQNETQNGFYINCLYNYSLGVRFFGSDGTSTGGWIYSAQIENAPSSLIHKENNSYGITRYFNQMNYINTSVEVDVNSSQNFNDSTQNPLPILVPDAKVSVTKATFGSTEYMLFASTTNSNSIIIYQYKLDDDALLHKVETDFANKIEVSQIIQNPNDQGIIILGQLHVSGRYLRPVLIKIPARDFKSE